VLQEIKNCERRSAREAGCKVFREVAQGDKTDRAQLRRMSYNVSHSTISRLTVANMTAAILSETEWSFDKVESAEPERAAKLKAAGIPEALIEALREALVQGFDGDGVRFGREQNSSQPDDWRSMLQFRVGTCLFDWFFNARTGYRAHFKTSPETGLKFNDAIVQMTVGRINAKASQKLDVTLLNIKYEYIGTAKIPREQFLLSFAPILAKIWLCALLIEPGQIKQLPTGATGPRIRVFVPG
jgi:hypothetical protein